MSTEQWIKLGEAFHKWPFKPDVLEDETYLQDEVMEDFRSTGVRTPEVQMKELGIEDIEDEIEELNDLDIDEIPKEDGEKL